MKCNNIERYLLDYFIDTESYENKRELFDHLNSCSDCRKSYVQYKELLDSSKSQDIYEENPRAELLDRVSQIARMNSKNKTESAWRKVFHTPVLVPVFGAVMIFMLLVNVTNDGINFINPTTQIAETDSSANSSDTSKKEVVAKKDNTIQDSRKELVAHVDYSPNSERQITISNIDSNFRSLRVSKPIFIKNVGERLFEVESNMVANANPEIIPAVDTSSNNPDVVIISDTEIEDIEDLRVDSDTAFTLQEAEVVSDALPIEDDFTYENPEILETRHDVCEDKIKENLVVLSSRPQPSFPVRKKAYLNLAECYELQDEWEYAVEAYYYLINMDKDNYDRYSDRINYIEKNYLQ